jgi:hypothetical protein
MCDPCLQIRASTLNESQILPMATIFHDMISGEVYDNAIDISACMDILSHILNAQVRIKRSFGSMEKY